MTTNDGRSQRGKFVVVGYLLLSFVLIAAGALVVVDGNVLGMGGGTQTATPESAPTPTSTLEPTPTATQTPIPTATPTATAAPTPAKTTAHQLATLRTDYEARLEHTVESDELRGVPALATDYREGEDGDLVLWLVYPECDEGDPLRTQVHNVGVEFANAIGNHPGAKPDRLRAYSVTDLINFNDTTYTIESEDAAAVFNGSIDKPEYLSRYVPTSETATHEQNRTAYRMAVNQSEQAAADDAFYNDHFEVGQCPPGAEMPD